MAILALLRDVSASQYLMITAICAVLAYVGVKSRAAVATGTAQTKDDDPDAPISVNYFPSRKCNYSCGFCFHTETSSYVLPTSEAKRGLRLLKKAGMRKLNIAVGEPFLYPRLLTELLRYYKEELGVESISIVSNGSKIREAWMRDNCRWLDILAVSCDSFDAGTNRKIGRGDDGGNVTRLFRVAGWCRRYGVRFKLNAHNWDEDMAAAVERLDPLRWKVFRCLIVAGENEDETRKRGARAFPVTEEQWKTFCDRHAHLECYVPEDNAAMASSYLLLDEYMRFVDKGEGMMTTSDSILSVGIKEAMKQVVWDKKSFVERGGIYDWARLDMAQEGGCNGGEKKELEW